MEWKEFIENEKKKDYLKGLWDFVIKEYAQNICCPNMNDIFRAFDTPYDDIKCVILGQDPYHGFDKKAGLKEAMGLSFSVPKGVTIPRSLKNIYKEIQDEYGYPIPETGDLTPWANQGVMLLNSILTVKLDTPASHKNKGWEIFTDNVLKALNDKPEPVVFMLWGEFAKSKKDIITNPKHLILEAPHPSPFSARKGFFGCGHFKKCNEFLERNGYEPIDWTIK